MDQARGNNQTETCVVDSSHPKSEAGTTVIVIGDPGMGGSTGDDDNTESFGPIGNGNKAILEEQHELRDDSCVIDVKFGEKVCRICYLNSEQLSLTNAVTAAAAAGGGGDSAGKKGMELIELGCGCKAELGIVHSHCAETWFKLRGNRMCEICGETAKNIAGDIGEERFVEECNERSHNSDANHSSSESHEGFCRGQPFCNFLVACLIVSLVLPWFFHLNMF